MLAHPGALTVTGDAQFMVDEWVDPVRKFLNTHVFREYWPQVESRTTDHVASQLNWIACYIVSADIRPGDRQGQDALATSTARSGGRRRWDGHG